MNEPDWDRKLWAMATNPWILAATAILQGKTVFDMLRNSGESIEMVLARWLLPLAITVALAAVVSFIGMRNLWSLTRMVIVGFAVVIMAQPLINAYVGFLLTRS